MCTQVSGASATEKEVRVFSSGMVRTVTLHFAQMPNGTITAQAGPASWMSERQIKSASESMGVDTTIGLGMGIAWGQRWGWGRQRAWAWVRA